MRSAIKKRLVHWFGVANFGRARSLLYFFEVGFKMLVGERRRCNLCRFEGAFRAYGHPPRYGAQCPRCLSRERHRLLKLWADAHPLELADKVILHFAPESVVSSSLRDCARKYIAADLDKNLADVVLNIEDIALPDQSVDVVVALHVLEHVDDRKALNELYRVLRPGGLAIVMVPLIEGWDATYEDSSIVKPSERVKRFGQWDHVRYYGRDVRDRIRSAGFGLAEFTATEPDVQAWGLSRGEKIFLCRRP